MSKVGAWEDNNLDFDEVSKYFNMTVNDAAQRLGVCHTVLNRICRENGLLRWPYRKVMGGKSIEEVKEEAARSKLSASHEQLYSTPPPAQASTQVLSHPQGPPTHTGRFSTVAAQRAKMPMPSFVDDFRYAAMPLATLSTKWWGDGEPGTQVDDSAGDAAVEDDAATAANRLVAARRKRADWLRKTVSSPIAKGYNGSKLNAREIAVLKFAFGKELPRQWSYAV